VDLGAEACVPEKYIPDLRTRVEVYRRLTGCRTEEELAEAEREVADRFGKAPKPVANFVEAMRVKLRAARWDIASVARGDEGIVLRCRDRKKAEELRRRDPRHVRRVDEETLLVVDRDAAELMK
jgi:transcription-repair coupling factor (superfamily II helicase)